jgi:hypothetical protein
MVTKISGSYEYNTICEVCGFKLKASKLKKRWDGYWVCEKDWETRNILDFYQSRNDMHTLPFTLADNESETIWTPNLVNVTQTVGTGTITVTGTYLRDNIQNIVNFTVQFVITGNATTASASATFSLPITSVSSGTVRVTDENGVFLGTGTIGAAATTGTLPNWAARNKTIIISGKYGV